jgi:SNF family Na+-dependent transporter
LRRKREIFVGCLFTFYFIVGFPSCTEGGYYIVELLNNYSAVYSIMVAVLIENIAVAWVYGITNNNKLTENLIIVDFF